METIPPFDIEGKISEEYIKSTVTCLILIAGFMGYLAICYIAVTGSPESGLFLVILWGMLAIIALIAAN